MLRVACNVCFLLRLLNLRPCASITSDPKEQAQQPGQFVVKLHKQRVPVSVGSESMSYKSVYFGTIFIGGPKQEFSVVFDTGSGHVVVPSELCKSPTCRIHRRYRRKASAAAVDVDYDGTLVKKGQPRDQITVAFGTGEVTGQFVSDSLCLSDPPPKSDAEGESRQLGSAASQEALVQNAAVNGNMDNDCISLRVVTATEMTQEPFEAFSFDGILGLGLDGLALAPEFSFFGQLIAQERVSTSTFGVFLAENEDDQSEICFGGHSPERLRSPISWSPVALPELGYWQVHINKVRVGNTSFNFCDDGQCRAVVDTGTSLLAVPKDFADDLQTELSAAMHDPPTSDGGQSVDCKKAEGAPLHFDIDGLTVTLSASDYAREEKPLEESESAPAEESVASTSGGGTERVTRQAKCQPTMMPIDMPAPIGPKLFIWGEPVLRKYYTLYDLTEKRIGFGLAAHRPQKEKEMPRKRKPLLR